MSTLIFAHRGDSRSFVEHTLPAFESAYQKNIDGINLDVQLSKDKELVLYRGEELDAMTDSSGKVSDKSLSELKKLTFKQDKQAEILSLKEYLAWVSNKNLCTCITISSHLVGSVEKYLAQALQDFSLQEKTMVISYLPSCLREIKRLDASIRVGYLMTKRSLEMIGLSESTYNLNSLFESLHQLNIDCICPHYDLLKDEFLALAEVYEFDLLIWPIDDEESLKQIDQKDLFGIMTTYPEKLANNLSQHVPTSVYRA